MNKSANDIDIELLKIISLEVYRDGGASLVRNLKEYNSRIDSLLKKRRNYSIHNSNINNGHDDFSNANTTNAKLLSFLEAHPTILEVNRLMDPHIVYLLSHEYLGSPPLQTIQHNKEETLILLHRKQKLIDRIVSILKKEESKNVRRYSSCTTLSTKFISVNIHWLLKQSKNQFHRYLRILGFYINTYSNCRDVKLVGSDDWNNHVLSEFELFVNQSNICQFDNDGRLFLNKNSFSMNHIHTTDDDNNHDMTSEAIQNLASILINTVREDGGTHVSLSLLLHRNSNLRKLLSGCDLLKMKSEYEHHFKDLEIFVKNDQIYLQRKENINQTDNTNNNNNNNEQKFKRMEVDETGLFSIASSKWGNAFTSLIGRYCQRYLSVDISEIVAIDLTASVGGITLSLAKSFHKVIAIEIDSHRATLCHRNMLHHGVADKVEIFNKDSFDFIPTIAALLDHKPNVVVIDPPWGGMYYKHDKEKINDIMLGKWSMVQVIERISLYLAPTIVGLRMPISYDSTVLLNTMTGVGISFESNCKKAGPQLFIIIYLYKNA